MANHSRNKGASAERELARIIYDELGIRMVRNLEQSRRGGHDLIPYTDQDDSVSASLARFAFEVKRHSRATPHLLKGWWAQTCQQAEAQHLIPCLCYRQDRMGWRVVIPLSAVRLDIPKTDGLDWTVELSVPAFAALIRES